MTTATPEMAYRSYADGMTLYGDLKFPEAIEAFRKSVAADPSFTLAQMRLGMSAIFSGQKDDGIQWIGKAAAALDKLPDRDKRLLPIVQVYLKGQDPAVAARQLEEFVKRYPKDPEASIWVAKADADVAGDRLGAIRVLRQVLDKEPDNLAAVSLLSEQVARLGRPGDAAAILKDYLARHPGASEPLSPTIKVYRKSAEEQGPGG